MFFYKTPLQLWQLKKNKLDQCLQLRMFEQDCEKMFDWIYSNREVFLANYVDIGRNHGKQQSPPTIAAKSIESYFVKESHLSISLSRILAQFLTLLCRRSQQASRRTRSIHSGLQCKFQPHVLSDFPDFFWFLFDRFFSSLSQHSFQFLYFQILSFLANCSRPSFTLSSSLQLMALLSTQPDLYTQTHSNQMWPSNSQSLDLN